MASEYRDTASNVRHLVQLIKAGSLMTQTFEDRAFAVRRELALVRSKLPRDHQLTDLIKAGWRNIQGLTVEGRAEIVEESIHQVAILNEEPRRNGQALDITWQEYARLPNCDQALLDRVCETLSHLADNLDGSARKAHATATLPPGNGDAPAPPCANTIQVDLAKQTITHNGTVYDVRSQQALRWIKVLSEHPGEWISSTDLHGYDNELDGFRPDKVRGYIPSEITTHIESATGKGSRFLLQA